jgi:hypothetical protein
MIAHSTSKRNLKVQKLGPSSEQQALMVRIDWTKSQVVKITAREDFKMPTVTMWVRKDGYKVISTQDVPVQKGMTLYFVASNEQGWYYLLKWSESLNKHACTCPSGRIRHNCRHQHILADHLEGEGTRVAQPAAREMKVFTDGEHYEPRYRNGNQWVSFVNKDDHVVCFITCMMADLAHKFIKVDSDEHRAAVWAEYQQRLVVARAAEQLQEVA